MYCSSTSRAVVRNSAKMAPVVQKIHDEALDPSRKYTDTEKKILKPANYLIQNKGNKLYGLFFKALNHWIGAPAETMQVIITATSQLYELTLQVDDIQDDSRLRRGLPCAHRIFGLPRTVAALNLGVWLVLEKLVKFGKPQKFKHESFFGTYLINVFLEMLRGQALEIFWRESFVCPTEEEYVEMVTKKTATGFAFTAENFNVGHVNKEAIIKIGRAMGVLFQIRDDYFNLTNEVYMKRKGFCEDLEEGKFSFPTIHAIQSHPEDKTVLNILKQRTKDDELKRYCLSLLRKYNSFEYTKEVLHKMEEEIKTNIQLLENNSLFLKFLEKIELIHNTN